MAAAVIEQQMNIFREKRYVQVTIEIDIGNTEPAERAPRRSRVGDFGKFGRRSETSVTVTRKELKPGRNAA